MAHLVAEILAAFTNNSVPLESPGTLPTIRIRRTSDNALVVTDASMTEVGDGQYIFLFTPLDTLQYSIRADGDPLAALQVTVAERFQYGRLSGTELNEMADAHITRDLSALEPFTTRSPGRAYQKQVNRVRSIGGVLEVYETDDSTINWTQNLTQDPNAAAIIEADTV